MRSVYANSSFGAESVHLLDPRAAIVPSLRGHLSLPPWSPLSPSVVTSLSLRGHLSLSLRGHLSPSVVTSLSLRGHLQVDLEGTCWVTESILWDAKGAYFAAQASVEATF